VNDEGFNIIIGTDVSYIPEAILPLFGTYSLPRFVPLLPRMVLG